MASGQPEEPKIDRRSLRWVEHRERRLEELIDSSCEAVREYGYGASMDQIADFCGTSKSILYRYFVDKEGLQFQMGERVIARLVGRIRTRILASESVDAMLAGAIDEYLRLVEQDPQVYLFMRVGEVDGKEAEDSPMLRFDDVLHHIVKNASGEAYLGDDNIPQLDMFVRLWTVGTTGIIRAIGEKWLKVRAIVDAQADSESRFRAQGSRIEELQLDDADLSLAHLSRDQLAEMMASILGRIVDGIVRDRHSVFTGDLVLNTATSVDL